MHVLSLNAHTPPAVVIITQGSSHFNYLWLELEPLRDRTGVCLGYSSDIYPSAILEIGRTVRLISLWIRLSFIPTTRSGYVDPKEKSVEGVVSHPESKPTESATSAGGVLYNHACASTTCAITCLAWYSSGGGTLLSLSTWLNPAKHFPWHQSVTKEVSLLKYTLVYQRIDQCIHSHSTLHIRSARARCC